MDNTTKTVSLCITLRGPAGSGKSRLARELLQRLPTMGIRATIRETQRERDHADGCADDVYSETDNQTDASDWFTRTALASKPETE